VFDNPEKMFIILVIALLIFGPTKLAGLGGTIGRTIRDFRSAMRGAHETFTTELEQAAASVEPYPAALPAPDPMAEMPPASVSETASPMYSWTPAETAVASGAPSATPPEVDMDEAASLASEPTAEALRKSLQGRS